MKNETLAALCQYLAEQSYMNNLLIEKLIAAGLLQRGELQNLYESDPRRKQEFFQDFLSYLASLGLDPNKEL